MIRLTTLLMFAGACTSAAPVPEPVAIDDAAPAPLPPPPPTAPPAPVARADLFVTLEQAGSERPIADRDTVPLQRAPFALRFPLKTYTDQAPHSVRVAASDSDAVHRTGVGAGIGEKDPLTPFTQGTGMAAMSEGGGYEGGLFLDSRAHHFLFHVSDKDTRVRVVGPLSDGRFEVAFDVKGIADPNGITPIDKTTLKRVFVAVLMDDDLDQRIDDGELVRFTLTLP